MVPLEFVLTAHICALATLFPLFPMHPAWILLYFPLTLSVDFYRVPYQPVDFYPFGTFIRCQDRNMCANNYLCNMWLIDADGKGQCYVGKPKKWTFNPAIESYVKSRSSRQCGEKDKYLTKEDVIDAFVDSFDCISIFEHLSIESTSRYMTIYEFIDKSVNATAAKVQLTPQKPPFTKNNYWKFYEIYIRVVQQPPENYSYSIDNVPVKIDAYWEADAYCRNGKVYLDGENMKKQLTQLMANGQPILNL